MIQTSSFQEMMDRKPTIHDMSDNGKCSNCGGCCNDILPLNNADIYRIKKYIKDNDIKAINHNLNCLATDTYDAVCPFRDEKHEKCIIYPVRPAVCRLFSCHNYYEDFKVKFSKVKGCDNQSCRGIFFS